MGSKKTKRTMIDVTKTFIRRGDRITIKTIADTCFVNIAAVNYHFGSKEVLIEIATEEILDQLAQELFLLTKEFVREDQKQEKAFTKALFKKIIEFVQKNPGALKMVFGIPRMHQKLGETLARCFGDMGIISYTYDPSDSFMQESRVAIVEKAIQRMIVVTLISPALVDYTNPNGVLSMEFFNDEAMFDKYVDQALRVAHNLF
jgi:TetR/AcrR family transcriptional regulator, regulator of cefoperazone and chloramphenicol sensitivity